jgi:hypothetical protein
MRVKRILFAVTILLFSSISCSGGGDISLERREWPATNAVCDGCIPIQFDRLKLLLPKEKLKKLQVLHMDAPAVSLSCGAAGDISLLLMDERKATGGLKEEGIFDRLAVDELHQFFVSLGNSNDDKQALDLSREVMGLTQGGKYLTLTGESASAFWIKDGDFDNQSLYIVEKGSKYAYQVAGPLTETFVLELLSNIRFD